MIFMLNLQHLMRLYAINATVSTIHGVPTLWTPFHWAQ